MTKNNSTSTVNTNLVAAKAILEGKTVLAHDRRAADAIKVDYTIRTVKGEKIVRTAYGVSNTMHQALSALAARVDVNGSLPLYIF